MSEKKVYKRMTIEGVYEFCKELGIICKSDTYTTVKSPLIFICTQCGEDFERNFDNLRNRRQTVCNLCGKGNGQRKQAFTIEYVRNFVSNESNCKLVSTTYINTDNPLDFICGCGESFTATFYKFKNVNKRQCTPCGDKIIVSKLLTPVEKIKEMVEEAGYSFVSRYHSSEDSKHTIKVICDKNHMYEVSYHSFRSGQRCPHCSSSFGEIRVEEFLRKMIIDYKIEYRFKGLHGLGGSSLRFDFAIFNSRCELLHLIEYDGKQHFEPVEVMGGADKFIETQAHDAIKNAYCKANNINLVRIPYWDFNNIEKILSKELENVMKERSA
jgi:DNA-directed RNA polymerase subunit RPC12/RpoP